MNKRAIGTIEEDKAAAYLQEQGFLLLERNYRCRTGEIDIIAADGSYLVFVEVKFRKNNDKGLSLEAVNYRKQTVICKVARHYLMTHHKAEDTPCRFDVVGIDNQKITLVKDAFPFHLS